jgi:hypothetical protein
VKHKMYAVCYEHEGRWEPYSGSIQYSRDMVRGSKAVIAPNTGRILTVMVEVIMPKPRKRSVANRGGKHD